MVMKRLEMRTHMLNLRTLQYRTAIAHMPEACGVRTGAADESVQTPLRTGCQDTCTR